MSSMVVWMLTLAVSLSVMIVSAAANMPYLHMGMTAAVSLVFALIAIWDNRRLLEEGANRSLVAASTANHVGMVLIWGALGLIVTYSFILRWHEWWHFFAALIAAAGIALIMSAALRRDGEAGKEDPTMLKLAHILSIVLASGMGLTIIGMLVDGKLKRFPKSDWAAQNIFFYGAIAMGAIAVNALMQKHKSSQSQA